MVTSLVAGCGDRGATPSDRGTIASTPLASAGAGGGPLFTALSPQQTGVEFENRFDWDNPRRNLYQHGYAGGGVCAGDFDGDGRPDLYLVSQVGRDRLYAQVADFRFQDVTDTAGLAGGTDWGTGAVFADVDDDGDLDLYVSNIGGNRLYRNDFPRGFVDLAEPAGVVEPAGRSFATWFFDVNNDGWQDLVVANGFITTEDTGDL